jgi:hypothetical protein
MLRITTAYTCRALNTLMPYAKTASLLNASICVAIFFLILAKCDVQLSLWFSQISNNLVSWEGWISVSPNRNDSVVAAFDLLKCSNSFFSGAKVISVFWAHCWQTPQAASNSLLFALIVLFTANRFVSSANPTIISLGSAAYKFV